MKTTISIADLEVSCIIGVLDHERTTKQLVSVYVEVSFDGNSAAKSESIELTHDYSEISRQIEFILSAGEFMLVESAAHIILRHLLLPPTNKNPQISRAKVTITKSDALAGTALAAVTVEGSESEVTYTREMKSWGYVDIIEETVRLGIYRLTLSPLATLPTHYHRQMRESELMMSGGLLGTRSDGEILVLANGERFDWEHNQAHGYTNSTSQEANILCIDRPRFITTDEIEI